VYFGLDGSRLEYEPYNIKSDPGQMDNLLYEAPALDIRKEWSRLHRILTSRLIDTGNLADGFPGPLHRWRRKCMAASVSIGAGNRIINRES
jgi:hypothetical protein